MSYFINKNKPSRKIPLGLSLNIIIFPLWQNLLIRDSASFKTCRQNPLSERLCCNKTKGIKIKKPAMHKKRCRLYFNPV